MVSEQRVVEIINTINAQNNKVIERRTLNISMATGAFTADKEIQLPQGKCVRIGAYISGADPAQAVNLALKSSDGTIIEPATHFKDWVPGNGGYYESLKPVNFIDRNVEIHLSSKVALAADLDIQLMFISELQQ